jgi:hypothetical protein
MDAQRTARDEANIEGLLSRMTAALEDAGIFVGAEIDGDTVVISGEVDSAENRQAAMDVARATLGRAGVRLVDAIDVMDIAPDTPFETSHRLSTDEYWGNETAGAPRDPNRSKLEFDPDFTDDIGTTDSQVAVEEGVPYFPPTDPVVRPADNPEELDILNGFAPDAMDDPALHDAPRGDDEIAHDVARALRNDAATEDFAIAIGVRGGVVVLRGEVPTLEDAENAEAVASNVAGVVEVREELRIASMRDRSRAEE